MAALGLMVAVTAAGAEETALGRRVVKEMELGPAFHTNGNWHLAATEPDEAAGDEAAQLCLTGPSAADGHPQEDCTALTATVEGVSLIYKLQTIDSITVAPIPTGRAGQTEPALMVRASFSGGGSGTLSKLSVWTYTRVTGTPLNAGPNGFFMEVFSAVTDDGGEQRMVLAGPLAGYLIVTDQFYTSGPTMADPQPYSVRVYRRASPGFVKVLELLTDRKYPTIRGGEPLAHPIDVELPLIRRALAAVYPRGPPR